MAHELIFYKTPEGEQRIEVVYQDDNFWMTQKALAELFGVQRPAITKHLKNIFVSCELEEKEVVSILEHTTPHATKDLVDFIKVYKAPLRARRKETDRFKKFAYDEIVARDKANLDILWLKDESLEDTENLPAPAELAAEIVDSLETALEEFRAVEEALTSQSK